MDEIENGTPPKKKSGMVMTIAAVAIVSVLGAGGGWFLGSMLAPEPLTSDEARVLEEAKATIRTREAAEAANEAAPPGGGHGEASKEDKDGLPKASTEANGVLQLDPITTNLSYPTENWIRLELALLFKGTPDVAMAQQIHEDIATYLRTVSLQQIQGPRGFQYLKDDIQERVDLRSEGRVTNVIFRTFVVQ
ncbi:flagellar basal body protein FliL [Rhizobium sp. Leaf371]|uniref:flagellar basal body-associated FliL family protein n=1 Tax=Rhizobium sp. Leaf371 TaxID=1736355 RepID=UPI000714E71D|nr:flagellar basal body-associated FliL family protein [Rhizobium sp. Leaf371]KQS65140.1 flagellar basal body protein FliL [Rhizobium sp. Leaf371]